MWTDEFEDGYAVPELIANHPKLEDVSWHNDASPSFRPCGLQNYEDVDMRLWVQHPDPEAREVEGGRFSVYHHDTQDEVYNGDDPKAAIDALLALYRAWRKNNPTKATLAKEARRKAAQAAEDAANHAAMLQHLAAGDCGCAACSARTHGLTVGTRFVVTHRHPWSGPERQGTERVTSRCRIVRLDRGMFWYVIEEVLAVSDPLPGGAYDGDKWRSAAVGTIPGGIAYGYAVEQLTAGQIEVVEG